MRASGYRLIRPNQRKSLIRALPTLNFFFFFFQLSQNSELERQQRIEAAHWSECVPEDQSKACINPMCQSGKNQAQLGSRTVELLGGGVCDTPAVYEQEAGTWWSFEEGPADTFYSQSVSRHFQRWGARDFLAVPPRASRTLFDEVKCLFLLHHLNSQKKVKCSVTLPERV